MNSRYLKNTYILQDLERHMYPSAARGKASRYALECKCSTAPGSLVKLFSPLAHEPPSNLSFSGHIPSDATMDPVSVLTVVKVVTAATAQLISLKSRYRNVPLQVSTLIGQLHIVQAALEQISAWTSKDLLSSPRYQHLAAQIEGSLDCFCPLILALQQHLDSLGSPDQSGMTARSKMSFLWNEQDLVSYSNLLDRQANALNLFLQAVQWYVCRDVFRGASSPLTISVQPDVSRTAAHYR